MNTDSRDDYAGRARRAIADDTLQRALASVQGRLGPATRAAYDNLAEGPTLRRTAHQIRQKAIEHLDILLETLADNIRSRGGYVYFAETGGDAVRYCLTVARRHGVQRVVKGKSMVTEEIGLNPALEAAGIQVDETDLGEFIIQLAGEPPSHIIAPAIHKTRAQVGRLFADKLGIAYTEDPPTLTRAARSALRKKFFAADMGISGCNLACAETGHITTVSNEGNIRMSTTLPDVHLAVMGMERVVANLEDHDILFRLLSRGAAAQKLGGYVSYVGGPGGSDFEDGPSAFYLVIVDNGRSRILADPEFREMLYCIRCSACLNVCPVYGNIGGHAYGSTYCGPVGAVVTPLLAGLAPHKDLFFGETLCGACRQACPVDIDLPRLLRALRFRFKDCAAGKKTPFDRLERLGFDLWAMAIRRPWLYRLVLGAAGWLTRLLPPQRLGVLGLSGPAAGWTATRNLRPVSRRPFRRRWADRNKEGR